MFGSFVIGVLIFGFIFYWWWISYTKAAPWVPMEAEVVERVMKIAEVGKGDVFYDLGSGDGRLVIAAALHGAKAYGVEIDFLRVLYSRFWIWILSRVAIGLPRSGGSNGASLHLNKQAKIIRGDIFKTDISEATVVCTYLLPKTHQELKARLVRELKPGTRVVAVGFEYQGWELVKIDPRGTIYGPIRLYRV